MVHRVSLDEAQEQLTQLIDAAVGDEVILITKDGGRTVQLVPLASPDVRPQFGSGREQMVMADDFDAPLADFDEYMR